MTVGDAAGKFEGPPLVEGGKLAKAGFTIARWAAEYGAGVGVGAALHSRIPEEAKILLAMEVNHFTHVGMESARAMVDAGIIFGPGFVGPLVDWAAGVGVKYLFKGRSETVDTPPVPAPNLELGRTRIDRLLKPTDYLRVPDRCKRKGTDEKDAPVLEASLAGFLMLGRGWSDPEKKKSLDEAREMVEAVMKLSGKAGIKITKSQACIVAQRAIYADLDDKKLLGDPRVMEIGGAIKHNERWLKIDERHSIELSAMASAAIAVGDPRVATGRVGGLKADFALKCEEESKGFGNLVRTFSGRLIAGRPGVVS